MSNSVWEVPRSHVSAFSVPCRIELSSAPPFDIVKTAGPVLLSLRGGRTLDKTGFSAADWSSPLELGRWELMQRAASERRPSGCRAGAVLLVVLCGRAKRERLEAS